MSHFSPSASVVRTSWAIAFDIKDFGGDELTYVSDLSWASYHICDAYGDIIMLANKLS